MRELENIVERLVVLGQSSLIKKVDLPEKIRRSNQNAVLTDTDFLYPREQEIIPLKAAVAATERQLIERAFQQYNHLGPAA